MVADDASTFSHEYRRASTLSDVLNRTLLILKKRARGVPYHEDAAEEEQLRTIARIVTSSLVDLLTSPAQPRQPEQRKAIALPIELITRLRNERGGDLAYFIDDLRKASAALESNQVDESTLRILETVAAAADVEASRVFRRMIRS